MHIFRLLRRVYSFVAYNVAKEKILHGDKTKMFGFTLDIPPTVFHPKLYFTTKIFARYLLTLDLSHKHALEIGCGTGLLSMIAASRNADVTAVDINAIAVDAARTNASVNHLENKIRVMHSDLFDALNAQEKFDLIIFNPPYYAKEPVNDQERAFFAGDEYRLIKEFASRTGEHIQDDGKILFLLTSDVDCELILSFFTRNNFRLRLVQSKRKYFEVISIYEFVK